MCERMDIHWCDLTPYAKKGSSIQSGVRPVIVIANNRACQYSPVIFVSPITSRLSKNKLPVHVEIGEECGINKPSIILLEQIITIDKKDLGDYIGKVPRGKTFEIDRALAISGGLNVQSINMVPKDELRIKRMLNTINETIEKIEKYNNEYFVQVMDILMAELKSYCKLCGEDYDILINREVKFSPQKMYKTMEVVLSV